MKSAEKTIQVYGREGGFQVTVRCQEIFFWGGGLKFPILGFWGGKKILASIFSGSLYT